MELTVFLQPCKMLLAYLAEFCETSGMEAIFDVVLKELNARKGFWPEICKAVPEVKYSWLSKLATGQIPEPSVVKIQSLYNYFRLVPRPEDVEVREKMADGATEAV